VQGPELMFLLPREAFDFDFHLLTKARVSNRYDGPNLGSTSHLFNRLTATMISYPDSRPDGGRQGAHSDCQGLITPHGLTRVHPACEPDSNICS
jgi:hypothetical protein